MGGHIASHGRAGRGESGSAAQLAAGSGEDDLLELALGPFAAGCLKVEDAGAAAGGGALEEEEEEEEEGGGGGGARDDAESLQSRESYDESDAEEPKDPLPPLPAKKIVCVL